MSGQSNYSYDAFISYSGFRKEGGESQFDRKVAERLHRALETYRVPKTLTRKRAGLALIPKRLKKVFRDRDEVSVSPNLNDSLIDALEKSRFLIVVCSPRARKSLWMNQEISIFRALGRQERILPLLIEGEPEEAFPSELLKSQSKRFLSGHESYLSQDILAQPLAADIRADSQAACLKLLKQEKFRLIAPILGCDYDTLRRREYERFVKRAFSAGAAMLTLLIMFSILTALLLIAQQRERRNAELAISSTGIIPTLASPDVNVMNASPYAKEIKIARAISDLESLQKDYPSNVQLLVTLRSLYSALATVLWEQNKKEEAYVANDKTRSMIIPIAISRLKSWDAEQLKVSNDLLSISDEPERERLRNLLKLWEPPDNRLNLNLKIDYADYACQYLMLIDTSTQEGKAEAQRVLRLGIELFEQARDREAFTKEVEDLVAEINRALNKTLG